MLNDLITLDSAPRVRADTSHIPLATKKKLPAVLRSFYDGATTSTGRATAYNTKQEQDAALQELHASLMAIDRGLYLACSMLPGTTDLTRQMAIGNLLSTKAQGTSVISPAQETAGLSFVMRRLPPQRMLKLVQRLRGSKVNNARTRKMILQTVIGSQALELWAVKYRSKMRTALVHALGEKTATALREACATSHNLRTERQAALIQRVVVRYFMGLHQVGISAPSIIQPVCEQIAFILGHRGRADHSPLISAYLRASSDFQSASVLPIEVVEGFRSRFHSHLPKEQSLKVAVEGGQMTEGTKRRVQKRAESASVEVKFDPRASSAVELYIHAYEHRMTNEMCVILAQKGVIAANNFPGRWDKIVVILDTSESMRGHESQKLRPMAVALATRDMLMACAPNIRVMDGRGEDVTEAIPIPSGHTDMALALVQAFKEEASAIFMITDGYENAPAGRVSDVLQAARAMGITTPVHQLTPTFAAETKSVRNLGNLTVTPVRDPGALGTGFLFNLLETDVDAGIAAILGTLPRAVLTAK